MCLATPKNTLHYLWTSCLATGKSTHRNFIFIFAGESQKLQTKRKRESESGSGWECNWRESGWTCAAKALCVFRWEGEEMVRGVKRLSIKFARGLLQKYAFHSRRRHGEAQQHPVGKCTRTQTHHKARATRNKPKTESPCWQKKKLNKGNSSNP